ncbi:MAG: HAD-IA family hydrolase [Rhodospirillaceae bacterium]
MSRLVIFDCDGTLVDSQDSIVRSMRAAFEGQGMTPPAAEAVRRIVGLPLVMGIRLLAGPEATEAQTEILADGYRHALRGLRQAGQIHDPLYPGTREALAELSRAGWLMAVATGKGNQGLRLTLETHGLSDYFLSLQTADGNPGKPHPSMILNAIADTGARPESTVMVGDTTFDMEMSRNAGTLAIGVAWGYHGLDELAAAGAASVIGDFADLVPQIHHLLEIAP